MPLETVNNIYDGKPAHTTLHKWRHPPFPLHINTTLYILSQDTQVALNNNIHIATTININSFRLTEE